MRTLVLQPLLPEEESSEYPDRSAIKQSQMLTRRKIQQSFNLPKSQIKDVTVKGAKTLKPPIIFGITQRQHRWMTHPPKLELVVPAIW